MRLPAVLAAVLLAPALLLCPAAQAGPKPPAVPVPGQHTRQEAPRAAAAASPSLNVVSSNTMLLPSFVTDQWAQDLRGGLIGAADYLAGRDVVVFQELFDNSASGILLGRLRSRYPYQTPVVGRSRAGWDETQGDYSVLTPEDGGVGIVSRWPITRRIQDVFRRGCGTDALSQKGLGYARLDVHGVPVHVIGTHLQADDALCGRGQAAAVRTAQLGEVRAFVDRLRIPSGEQVIIAGDMNIDRYGPEYRAMLRTLGAAPPAFDGPPYTMDPVHNTLAGKRYGGEPGSWLDYVLFDGAHAHPAWRTITGLPVHSPPWTLNGRTYTDYSDHYPVQGG